MSYLDFKLETTKYAGHAFEIIRNQLSPGEYDGIVFISGDGLIHEGINGVMGRKDKNLFIEKTTFGFIPAGTSNGMVHSIFNHNGENSDFLTAAFRICK
jgi:sphingosine kinase